MIGVHFCLGNQQRRMSDEKFIFLDIDGVLRTERNENWRFFWGLRLEDEYGQLFSPSAIRNLERIIKSTGAKVVVSSNWRHFGLNRIREMWERRGLPGVVAGVTPFLPDLDGVERGQEVHQWLVENNLDNAAYVIMDDREDILTGQKDKFVKVSYRFGITLFVAWKAIRILKRETKGR